jgi:hypothetical protein
VTRGRGMAIAFVLQALVLFAVAVVALDLYAHKRAEGLAGLNVWGYRGAVAHQKQSNEIRLVVIGGARAFGLGSAASWTVATVVRQQVMLAIDRPGRPIRDMVSLTLAWPGALPESYTSTLDRFAYLKPDYICIYDDLGVGGALLREERSGTFALTGYWPALPVALQEKGMLWRFGSVRAGYVTQLRPAPPSGLLYRAAGAGLQLAGRALSGVDGLFAHAAVAHRADDSERYAMQLMAVVDAALARSRGVVVAVSPAELPLQASTARSVLPRLEARVSTAKRLRLVNLAEEPMLLDASQRFDDWNYGGDAIAAAAKRIAPAVIDLIAADAAASSR